jgi:hypothetical protein
VFTEAHPKLATWNALTLTMPVSPPTTSRGEAGEADKHSPDISGHS